MVLRHRLLGALPALLVGSSIFVFAGSARAQEPFGIDSPTPGPPAPEGTEQSVVARYWQLGRPRLFGSLMLEAGYAYVRPRFGVGYGQPYWSWVGLEGYPVVSLASVGQYLGIGAALPGVTLRVGARYMYPFSGRLLVPRDSYTRTDLEQEEGPRADHLALESELTGTVPILVGSAFAVLTAYRTELVDDGFFLYEEALRTIMAPPYIWRARLGYLLSFGRDGSIRVGPVGEVIGIPERSASVIRAGFLGSVLINAHLEAQASLIPVITSPDTIGLAGGDFGQLGVRFRWATGSTPDPERVRRALETIREERGIVPEAER